MNEIDVGNIRFKCKSCSDKLKKEFQKSFNKYSLKIGAYVKKEFIENWKSEHMWVQIIGLKENRIIGILSNCPLVTSSLNYGDIIEFDFCEIEDFDQGKEGS